MENIEISIIPKTEILSILPLLQKLNNFTPIKLLKERVIDMSKQHYECVGMYHKKELIGIAGLWFLTRHYCGKTIEPDHVIINENFRNKGLGTILFNWIHNYAQELNLDSCELNTYIENTKSHKFYDDLGYKKLGFHFLKKL